MKIIKDTEAVRSHLAALRAQNKKIVLVMTMGFLHEGHLSLMRLARQHGDHVIASIFVNPTQFNQPEDLEKYPRDLPRDIAMLESASVDSLYVPNSEGLYGENYQSWITIEELTKPLEGACRPGHFRGVTTIVGMVFNIIQPDTAIFGEKDFQQLSILERMVRDLKFPIKIVRGPLIREADGLAMSSRNVRLSENGRAAALALSRGLRGAQAAWRNGERKAAAVRAVVEGELNKEGTIKTEYVAVVDETTLQEVQSVSENSRVLVAAWVDGVRLIDNMRPSA